MAGTEKNTAVRCPRCGSTDVKLDVKSGKLKCAFCRSLFDLQKANEKTDVSLLKGKKTGAGAANIVPDESAILTLKCPSCGAEVVINTDEVTTARCHWCRHVLSVNEKMPNGAVPDLVLPFKLEKGTAEASIRKFVQARQFFANPQFKKEFNAENVMGVYLPYMVVDVNAHAKFAGEAEKLVRTYTVGKNDSRRYDADVYKVWREFDLLVDDLTVEASTEKMDQNTDVNSNNVINAVMPFDTENAVAWDARFLRGFASEKRDTDTTGRLEGLVQTQTADIARYRATTTMEQYDRGACWAQQDVTVVGTEWKAAYLPIWLYSYLEDDGKKKLLHYVAVNARTGETSGSVPVYKKKLLAVSVVLEIMGIIFGTWWFKFWIVQEMEEDNPAFLGLAGLLPGVVFYHVKMAKYRSLSARHMHERETRAEIRGLKQADAFSEHRKGLSNARIAMENDREVKGALIKGGGKMSDLLKDPKGAIDVMLKPDK